MFIYDVYVRVYEMEKMTLLYKYNEDSKYKKYVLRQRAKSIMVFLFALWCIGLIMILAASEIEKASSARVAIGSKSYYIQSAGYAPSKATAFLLYAGLFFLFGIFIVMVAISMSGVGLSLTLDCLSNLINGKEIIHRGGIKSYFNNDEISIWLKK